MLKTDWAIMLLFGCLQYQFSKLLSNARNTPLKSTASGESTMDKPDTIWD